MFVTIRVLFHIQKTPIANWAFAFAGQLFIALPMALLNMLAINQIYDYTLPLALFIFLWLNDSGAYCFGCGLRN